jgi:hypothetical protein
MSYFGDRRKANYEANKAAIATHKTLSPYADYEGGKYEPMQYEGNDRPDNLFPTLAQLQHQQANYGYYLAKLTQARKEADAEGIAVYIRI